MLRILLLIVFAFASNMTYGQCPHCGNYHPPFNLPAEPTKVEEPKEVKEPVEEPAPTITKIIEEKPAKVCKLYYQDNIPNTYPTWTWPGDLYSHLLYTHNRNTANWSHQQRVKLHNYLHNSGQTHHTQQMSRTGFGSFFRFRGR